MISRKSWRKMNSLSKSFRNKRRNTRISSLSWRQSSMSYYRRRRIAINKQSTRWKLRIRLISKELKEKRINYIMSNREILRKQKKSAREISMNLKNLIRKRWNQRIKRLRASNNLWESRRIKAILIIMAHTQDIPIAILNIRVLIASLLVIIKVTIPIQSQPQ